MTATKVVTFVILSLFVSNPGIRNCIMYSALPKGMSMVSIISIRYVREKIKFFYNPYL